jgi:hypothetical protein
VPVLAKTPIKLTSKKELNMTKSKTPMTPEAAARIQSSEAIKNGGKVEKGTFAPRAQRASETNQKSGK